MNVRHLLYFTAASLSVCALGLATRADSLYPLDNTPSGSAASTSIAADNRAHKPGDILTIVITESATGSSNGTTASSKTESGSFGPGFGPIFALVRQFGLSGNQASNGTGSTTRTDSLNATIAVTVTKLLPNGNLLVEGKRSVQVNSETEEISVKGTVRPSDVAADNTIQSPLVADAQISYSGKGTVSDKQHNGIITRIFRTLF